ncbi:MAG: flavin reductase family protein [Anaerolineae bacterium]|nr:flavin reductase family protein [Anaerolineae bacterium]
MIKYQEIAPESINENAIQLISKEWMLITAGTIDHFNMMTASWGGLGFLWGMPVSFAFVRPQRYTYEFMEQNTHYTLSFYENTYRDALNICGTKSGRDIDKVAETGLSPVADGSGAVYFTEAKLVLVCRKLYKQQFVENKFQDTKIPTQIYAAGDYHHMYVGEIIRCLHRLPPSA